MSKQYRVDDFIQELRRAGGGVQQTVLRILGDTLGEHGAAFLKRHVEYEGPDGPCVVDAVETNFCSNGHAVDDKVRVAGTCQTCKAILCSTPGCLLVCSRCGAVCCRSHCVISGEKVYCLNRGCRWAYYWRLFWRLDHEPVQRAR